MNQENYPKIYIHNGILEDFPEFVGEYYLVMDAYNIKEEIMAGFIFKVVRQRNIFKYDENGTTSEYMGRFKSNS